MSRLFLRLRFAAYDSFSSNYSDSLVQLDNKCVPVL